MSQFSEYVLEQVKKPDGSKFESYEDLIRWLSVKGSNKDTAIEFLEVLTDLTGAHKNYDGVDDTMISETLKNFYSDNPDIAESMIKRKRADALGDATKSGLETIFRGADIASSIKQIKQGDKGLRELTKPEQPTFTRNQAVDGLVRDSRAEYDRQLRDRDLRSLSPEAETMRGENAEAYRADLNQARVASGGNLGNYSALAQSAANRKYKNNRRLGDFIREDLGMSNQEVGSALNNYSSAVSRSMFQDRAQDNFNSNMFNTNLGQYNRDRDMYNNLASLGRGNLRNSLYNFSDNVPEYVKAFSNPSLGFGKDIDDLTARVNRELVSYQTDPTLRFGQ